MSVFAAAQEYPGERGLAALPWAQQGANRILSQDAPDRGQMARAVYHGLKIIVFLYRDYRITRIFTTPRADP